MARRKQSAFEDLIELAASLPWWVGLLLAILSYLVIHPFAIDDATATASAGEIGKVASKHLIRTLASVGQFIVPVAFLVGAGASAMRRGKRKRILKDAAEAKSPNPVKNLSWREFEMLVGEAFRQKGYSVKETADGADGGVDLELHKDRELFLVQCKQWRATKVGVKIVRELFGVMAARGAVGAYVVTSGFFTKEARAFADGRNITLIDGEKLSGIIRRAGKTAQNSKRPATRKPNRDAFQQSVQPAEPIVSQESAPEAAPRCPTCDGPMIKRVARRGSKAGSEFWGCANFPKCRGTRPLTD